MLQNIINNLSTNQTIILYFIVFIYLVHYLSNNVKLTFYLSILGLFIFLFYSMKNIKEYEIRLKRILY